MRKVAVILALAAACACAERNPNAARDAAERMALRAYPELPAVADVPALREAGRTHFRSQACEMCHSTSAERKGLAGPPMGGLAVRVLERHGGDALEGRRWLVKHIRDPHVFPSPHAGTAEYRGAAMPPNGRLQEKQLREIVEYLWSLP